MHVFTVFSTLMPFARPVRSCQKHVVTTIIKVDIRTNPVIHSSAQEVIRGLTHSDQDRDADVPITTLASRIGFTARDGDSTGWVPSHLARKAKAASSKGWPQVKHE